MAYQWVSASVARPIQPGWARTNARTAASAQVDVGDVVLVILLGINAKQDLDARQQARRVQPDFRVLRVEAKQRELRVGFATLEPGSDERIPKPVDCGRVVGEREHAFD